MFSSYTMTTAGSEGFIRMFPVYVEHVLFPTLTKEGYITEVINNITQVLQFSTLKWSYFFHVCKIRELTESTCLFSGSSCQWRRRGRRSRLLRNARKGKFTEKQVRKKRFTQLWNKKVIKIFFVFKDSFGDAQNSLPRCWLWLQVLCTFISEPFFQFPNILNLK